MNSSNAINFIFLPILCPKQMQPFYICICSHKLVYTSSVTLSLDPAAKVKTVPQNSDTYISAYSVCRRLAFVCSACTV